MKKQESSPSGAVDNEWNVKKQASRSCSVGPVGIRYMGYQATEIQLDGRRSQLLYVFRSGNLLENTEIISAKGCLPYGASCSTYWKIGDDSWLLDSLSSLEKPWSVQTFSTKHWVVIPMDLSFSLALLTSLLVSGALSSSLSSLNRQFLLFRVVGAWLHPPRFKSPRRRFRKKKCLHTSLVCWKGRRIPPVYKET